MLNIEINVNEDIEEDNDFLHHIFNAIFYKHVSFINLRYKQNIWNRENIKGILGFTYTTFNNINLLTVLILGNEIRRTWMKVILLFVGLLMN